jgi:hypothetical protein
MDNIEHVALPSVSELYLRHGFAAYLIDNQAGVPAGTTDKMIQNVPVLRAHAKLVLTAISVKAQQNYTLNNVTVKLADEGKDAQSGKSQ